MATKKFKVAGYAASELDIQLEVAEVGDKHWGLLAQWDGTHMIVFDADQSARLSDLACDLANGFDTMAEEREGSESRRTNRAIATGLYGLSKKLRLAYA